MLQEVFDLVAGKTKLLVEIKQEHVDGPLVSLIQEKCRMEEQPLRLSVELDHGR